MNGGASSEFVLFHSKTCPHCTRFLPIWEAFCNQYTGPCVFKDFEASANPDLFNLHKIYEYGVPHMRLFPTGMGGEYVIYGGGRTVEDLNAFMSTNNM